jgi:hypothetical protein
MPSRRAPPAPLPQVPTARARAQDPRAQWRRAARSTQHAQGPIRLLHSPTAAAACTSCCCCKALITLYTTSAGAPSAACSRQKRLNYALLVCSCSPALRAPCGRPGWAAHGVCGPRSTRRQGLLVMLRTPWEWKNDMERGNACMHARTRKRLLEIAEKSVVAEEDTRMTDTLGGRLLTPKAEGCSWPFTTYCARVGRAHPP